LKAIFSTSCPSCGAPVEVYSATAVMVVCPYCQSSLVRTDNALLDSGKKSAVIEDYSPLQLYTSGTYEGQPFTLIGRLQVQYDRGVWNEWHALLDNGRSAWLAESGGQYVFTSEQGSFAPPTQLSFAQLRAGQSVLNYQKTRFIAADIRTATAFKANAQGELPYPLQHDQPMKVADFRNENRFLTLDYSDNSSSPLVYLGQTVQLSKLSLQNLRDQHQILQQAGKIKGTTKSSQCPNCGGSIAWVEGMTAQVVCQSCHADIDLSADQAKVVEIYNFRKSQEKQFSLKLGQTASIDQVQWTIIGLVKKAELESADAWPAMLGDSSKSLFSSDGWLEYLLYNPQAGFLWLVESSDGTWAVSTTLNQWPKLNLNQQPYNQQGQIMAKLYDYGGRVEYAAGAFYWHIQPNDINCYSDYGSSNDKLSAEYSKEELAWSNSKTVSVQQIAQWFGQANLMPKPQQRQNADNQSILNRVNNSRSGQQKSGKNTATLLLLLYGFINFPAFLMSFSSLFSLIIVGAMSYFVYFLLGKPFNARNQEESR
jgi:endogenous inhibitor of DNA gyrase (YacG/DUF329 family)